MPSKLLIPKPMIAIELCTTCGREHVDPRGYRRCAVCGALFCWQGRPRGENFFGVERRPCGSRGAASRRAHDGAADTEFAASRGDTSRVLGGGDSRHARDGAAMGARAASRRGQFDFDEPAPWVEYRCRRHSGHSWVLFGADWAAIRPIAIYLFLCVTFSVAFWGLVFLLVSAWLRQQGIG